eukprot:TRINITY_DN2589_c0_g2_i1.p1 TRINITY_DN2589_c0_g2~~TRINITY_DN2589_c0_g2_i1.p1  ORF type:complete len:434 (+),score=128.29 TRINITY_DN2589_c0_g2_i1:70-1302(+)
MPLCAELTQGFHEQCGDFRREPVSPPAGGCDTTSYTGSSSDSGTAVEWLEQLMSEFLHSMQDGTVAEAITKWYSEDTVCVKKYVTAEGTASEGGVGPDDALGMYNAYIRRMYPDGEEMRLWYSVAGVSDTECELMAMTEAVGGCGSVRRAEICSSVIRFAETGDTLVRREDSGVVLDAAATPAQLAVYAERALEAQAFAIRAGSIGTWVHACTTEDVVMELRRSADAPPLRATGRDAVHDLYGQQLSELPSGAAITWSAVSCSVVSERVVRVVRTASVAVGGSLWTAGEAVRRLEVAELVFEGSRISGITVSTQPVGEAAAAAAAAAPPPRAHLRRGRNQCSHNSWDSVRSKHGSVNLRCRVCNGRWRPTREVLAARRCALFDAGECVNEACPRVHVHKIKLRKGERADQ